MAKPKPPAKVVAKKKQQLSQINTTKFAGPSRQHAIEYAEGPINTSLKIRGGKSNITASYLPTGKGKKPIRLRPL